MNNARSCGFSKKFHPIKMRLVREYDLTNNNLLKDVCKIFELQD